MTARGWGSWLAANAERRRPRRLDCGKLAAAMPPAKVFPFRRPVAEPRLRLLCLPFAGGASSLYRSWPRALPTIEVWPIELPGRGVRPDEPLVTDMTALVDGLAAAISEHGDLPLALFGHSMGARIAFELARRLGSRVVHLFASGSQPPEVAPYYAARDTRPTDQLTDDELMQRIQPLGGTPKELLAEPELMQRALPIVRADLVLVERYRVEPDARVACPLTVLTGRQDPIAPPAVAAGWLRRSTGATRIVELDAAHFFLDSHRAAVLAEIARDLGL
jgi:surfactin synthase thioesterase subunit